MEQEILLDTNILSELMRPKPDVRVLSWFGLNTEAGYYISAVTQAEILLGISVLKNVENPRSVEYAVAG
jgi:predicted nucleic acid-binding protein